MIKHEMDRIEIKASSMIKEVGYDENRMLLEVTFARGSVFHYEAVPQYIWVAFKEAESKGKYFHQNIKTTFVAHKIRGDA